MPLITVIFFFIFVGLLFLLNNVMKNRKKLKRAVAYGVEKFEIDLPNGASIDAVKSTKDIPAFSSLTDAEGFFQLITPYIGSLSVNKREYLNQSMSDLKNDLKMNKEIYQYFTDEYKIYKGLSEEKAAQKWAGK